MREYKHPQIDILCDYCGTPYRVFRQNYLVGTIRSCGCLKKNNQNALKHGHSRLVNRSPTYVSWTSMWARCTNKNTKDYKNYGGRGINIHPEWKLFENFLRDMGERPIDKTLDRINPNEGYELLNCRWATIEQQAKNKRGSYAKNVYAY